MNWKDWIHRPLLGNPLWLWGAAVFTGFLTLLILLVVRRVLTSRLKAWAERHDRPVLHLISRLLLRTSKLFLAAMAVLAGSQLLEFGKSQDLLRRIILAVSLLQAGLWGSSLLYGWLERWRERRAATGSTISAIVALGFIGQIAIWTIVLLLTLDNFGVRVTALLTGLGVGGVAVALAVQNVLGDLFASISILMDRPFELGDFIIVDDLMGDVEYIGLKTTRLRSLSGEQIIVSNSNLLSSRIRNYKRMRERRVVFSLNVSYRTPLDRVRAIPEMLRTVITAQDKVRFDRAHFSKLGDHALVYEAVYFVTDPDYNLYMDLQQTINLQIMEWFLQNGVQFAPPTTMLMHESVAPRTAGQAAEAFMPPHEASAAVAPASTGGNGAPGSDQSQ